MGKFRQKTAVLIMLLASCAMINSCAYFITEKPLYTAEYYFKNKYYHEAFSRIWMPANLGRPRAQYALGYMYYYGLGAPVDHDAARFWFSRAACNHYPPAKEAIKMLTNPEYTQYDELTKLSTLKPKRYSYLQFTAAQDQVWIRDQSGNYFTVCLVCTSEIPVFESFCSRVTLAERVVKYRYKQGNKIYYAAVTGNYPTQREAEDAALRINKTLHINSAQPITWRAVHQVMLPL